MNKENPFDPQNPLEGCESSADKPSDGFVTWAFQTEPSRRKHALRGAASARAERGVLTVSIFSGSVVD